MKEGVDWFDLSPVVSERMGVFPGDTPFRRTRLMSFEAGHHLELSKIETTVHLGAHADAPSHYDRRGSGIGERDLFPYLGRCQVLDARAPRGARVAPEHLWTTEIKAPRILLRTGSFPDPDRWNSDFCSLEPRMVDWLADQGVVLVGVDTPSIDPEDSKELESHARVRERGLAILEGLVLDRVPDGVYSLVALPLRLEGADASPVRAVLLRDPSALL